jgi:hypothetical protein
MKGMIDILFAPLAVLVIGIILFVILEIYLNLSDAFSSLFALPKESIGNTVLYVFYAVYFGIPIAGIILSLLVGSHPVFMVLGIIFLIFGVFLSGIYKQIFVQVLPSLNETYNFVSSNTVVSSLIDYYPFVMLLTGMGILIAQFIGGRHE